jgi:Leucine-rich repeat (LRR) protein
MMIIDTFNDLIKLKDDDVLKVYKIDIRSRTFKIITDDLFIKICKCTNLVGLRLDYLNISTIPSVIGNLINLKFLYLEHNNLECVPIEISKLSNLESLYLNNNYLTTLPKQLCELENLKELELKMNPIKYLPNEFAKLLNLKSLVLDYDVVIDSLVYENNMLLIIRYTNCAIIPQNVTNLCILRGGYIHFDDLPNTIEYLHITDATESLSNLPISLKTLKLSFPNKLHTINTPYGCNLIIDSAID